VRKIFIVDTSVLLYDRDSISSFPGNDVILPMTVLDELDRNKQKPGLVGENARYVNRYLDGLRSIGRLDRGVKLSTGGQTIRIYTSDPSDLASRHSLDTSIGDNRIISVALELQEQNKKKQVVVVTKDINLRVKCDALGIDAEDYYKDYINSSSDELEAPTPVLETNGDDIDDLYTVGWIDSGVESGLHQNQYVVCQSICGKSALGRYRDGKILKVTGYNFRKLGQINAKNKEQTFALDALGSDDMSLVCLTGIAGSGKTFITLMAALDSLQSGLYERIVVTRSIQPVGKEIGYLPGDIREKMAPWMAPLVDNFRYAFKDMSYFEMMLDKGLIDIAPLSFIRGRTFNKSIVIVDEAQNTTIHELKTIITRVGIDSKIVLMGDTDQVDTPYIDKRSNGLSIVIDKMRNTGMLAHVHLAKGERSELATLASKML
jgi:PhoH-like ATPase